MESICVCMSNVEGTIKFLRISRTEHGRDRILDRSYSTLDIHFSSESYDLSWINDAALTGPTY